MLPAPASGAGGYAGDLSSAGTLAPLPEYR